MSYLRTADAWADGVKQTLNPDGTNAGFNVGANAVDPSALVNGDVWYQSTANELRARINGVTVALGASSATAPFDDGTAIVKGSITPTKLLRFEVDGFTAATTRVITPPDADINLPGTNIANSWSQTQTFQAASNIFGLAANANNRIQFSDVAAAGSSILDFGTGGTTDLNFIRKYSDSPFQVELASSVGVDIVIDSNNNETGTSVRFLTNGIRGGAQTLLFTIQDNGGLVATGALNMGTNLINNVVNPVSAQDAATKSYVDTAVTGVTPPFTDTTALVKGSGDATKLLRFEVDGFTTATTRVLTPPNQNATIAGLEVLNAFTVLQTFSAGASIVGPFSIAYRATAVTTTFLATDHTIDATSGTFTVNLPTAAGITGRMYVAKNSGVGTITLDPAGAELIDGLATATIVAGASLTVQSTGAAWIII